MPLFFYLDNIMTLNQIVDIIAQEAGRPFDVPFKEECKQIVSAIRQKFMKDSLEKRPQDRQLYTKGIVAELVSVHKIQCPIEYGCTLRTKLEIPQPIRSNNIIFEFVGSADFEVPFSLGGDWRETYFKHNRYTAKKTRYVFRNNYIYVSDNEGAIDLIGIIGVFEDTSKLSAFQCSSSTGNCGFDDSEYPMPGDLIYPLIKEALSLVLGAGAAQRKDETEIKVDQDKN